MNGQHDDLSVMLPVHSAWNTAIQATEKAMGNVDEKVYLMPQSADSTGCRDLRDMALDLAENNVNTPMVGQSRINYGCPTRTNTNVQNSMPSLHPGRHVRVF